MPICNCIQDTLSSHALKQSEYVHGQQRLYACIHDTQDTLSSRAALGLPSASREQRYLACKLYVRYLSSRAHSAWRAKAKRETIGLLVYKSKGILHTTKPIKNTILIKLQWFLNYEVPNCLCLERHINKFPRSELSLHNIILCSDNPLRRNLENYNYAANVWSTESTKDQTLKINMEWVRVMRANSGIQRISSYALTWINAESLSETFGTSYNNM